MSLDIFKKRETALEFEFCHKIDQQLLQELRAKLDAEQRQHTLARTTGIKDESVLQELDSLEICGEHVLALSLYPLVHVAWADDAIDERERKAVLSAAESIGHLRDSASYHLLQHWLDERPAEAVFTAWKDYVIALLQTLSPVAQRALRFSLFSNARKVAEAAGGLLGVHKISAVEEAALAELRSIVGETTDSGPDRVASS